MFIIVALVVCLATGAACIAALVLLDKLVAKPMIFNVCGSLIVLVACFTTAMAISRLYQMGIH